MSKLSLTQKPQAFCQYNPGRAGFFQVYHSEGWTAETVAKACQNHVSENKSRNKWSIYLSTYLSIYPSIYLSIYFSIYLSVYLSLRPSNKQTTQPSIHPSGHLFIQSIWPRSFPSCQGTCPVKARWQTWEAPGGPTCRLSYAMSWEDMRTRMDGY